MTKFQINRSINILNVYRQDVEAATYDLQDGYFTFRTVDKLKVLSIAQGLVHTIDRVDES